MDKWDKKGGIGVISNLERKSDYQRDTQLEHMVPNRKIYAAVAS